MALYELGLIEVHIPLSGTQIFVASLKEKKERINEVLSDTWRALKLLESIKEKVKEIKKRNREKTGAAEISEKFIGWCLLLK